MNSIFFQHIYTSVFSSTVQRIILLFSFVIASATALAGDHTDRQPKKQTVNKNISNPGLVLTSFNVAIANNKVALFWITGMEKDFSHFVIERSSDGVDYKDAALVFANGNSEVQQSYYFADAVNTSTKAVWYYRLRMVSTGGRYNYSTPCTIRTGEVARRAQLQVQPNPVASELRITIPEAWQNKPVSFDVYNGNGQLVKHVVNQNASQFEPVNMQDMTPGVYMIKARTGSDSAVQWIIKK